MSGWLLDTNIVSQFAPRREGAPPIEPRLKTFVQANSDRLYISSLTVAEITSGIWSLHRSGAERRAADLSGWLDRILHFYADRALSIDVRTGRIAGELEDRARSIGRGPGLADILIAATAQANGLTLLTHNRRHFDPLGLSIAVLDPLDPETRL